MLKYQEPACLSSCHIAHTDLSLSGTLAWMPTPTVHLPGSSHSIVWLTCQLPINYGVTCRLHLWKALYWTQGSWLFLPLEAGLLTNTANWRGLCWGTTWFLPLSKDNSEQTWMHLSSPRPKEQESPSSWVFQKERGRTENMRNGEVYPKDVMWLCSIAVLICVGAESHSVSYFPTELCPPLPGCPPPAAQHTRQPTLSFNFSSKNCVCVKYNWCTCVYTYMYNVRICIYLCSIGFL